MPKFIYVPQGCYAEIKPNTPADIIGLATAEMSTCSHVIVANRATGHLILCHADQKVDLENQLSGVPAWIRQVCPDGDYGNLVIDTGERQENPRFRLEENLEGTNYFSCFEKVKRGAGVVLPGFDGITHQTTIVADDIYAVSALRNGIEIRSREEYTKALVDIELLTSYEAETLHLESQEDGRELECSIVSANNYAAAGAFELYPPICVFDGTSNDFLTMETLRQRNSFIAWDRVERDARSTPTESDTERSSSGDIGKNVYLASEHNNLVRSEKTSFTQKAKFIDILCEGLSEKAQAKIFNMREDVISQPRHQLIEESTAKINNTKPNVTLIPESNHEADHRANTQKLTQGIIEGKIKNDTVIGLERKEAGINFGIQDVVLLAKILEHNKNKPQEAITISNKIQNSLIYQDAMLYSVAKLQGIEVMGLEGKRLEHGKESPEYHSIREAHMAKQLEQLITIGKNVIFPVGAAHSDGLKARLSQTNILIAKGVDGLEDSIHSPSKGRDDFRSKVIASKSPAQSLNR